MDNYNPTRDRLHYQTMDEPPDKKRRFSDHQSTSSSSIIDTIVNASSSWPLNSLNSSALPTYDESIANNSYRPYYDRDHYVNHSKSPLIDRQYTMVDKVPMDNNVHFARDEANYSLQEPGNQGFGSQYLKQDNSLGGVNDTYNNNNITTTDANITGQPKQLPDPTLDKNTSHSTTTASTTYSPKPRETLADDLTKGHQSDSLTVYNEPSNPRVQYESSTNKIPSELLTNDSNSMPDEVTVKKEPEDNTGSPPHSNGDNGLSPGVKMAEDAPSFHSPPVQNSNDSFNRKTKPDVPKIEVKKENDKEDLSEMYSFLDWKDGIATLPGSNLKFRTNEFGTLEMISTVETEKGEYEWTTSTATPSTDLLSGPPADGNVLCCEVCGVYGLPQDFCSSGRFCSLSCVGSYTGKRNKGREFVKNLEPVERKPAKKKKKGGKGKRGTPSPVNKEDSGFLEDVTASSPKVKTPREKTKGRHKLPPAEATGQCLTGSMVPYNFSKPFTWTDYLYSSGTKPVPMSVFKQENPDIGVFPMPCEEFKKNMKLEAVDPKHPSYICVCTIVRVKGSRLRLHFDGWSECYDFWTNADSPDIFPVGWCEENGQTLHPPRSFTKGEFNWHRYLKKQSRHAASPHLFSPISEKRHGFEIGMKLEAIDRKNPDLICVATVTNVIGNRFLVHFDEWDDTYDYWCEEDCPYIHPVGWCESTGRRLTPPNDDEVHTFSWKQYLKKTGTKAAPPELFITRPFPAFKVHQKLEAVDKRNPSLIRCTTIAQVLEYRVRIHFDGWDDVYDDWFDAESTDLHCVGYCTKTGHPLEPPLTTADKISSVACPTPGCKGIGHVKGAKYSSHHSTFGCPYSLQNLNKESCLVDRLSTNSMTEESDWSYASKNKANTGAVSVKREVLPESTTTGSSHVSGNWRTQQSSAGGPKTADSNVIKIPRPPIPIQPAPLKETLPSPKKKVNTYTIETTSASSKVVPSTTAATVRRQSKEIKREKFTENVQYKQIAPKKIKEEYVEQSNLSAPAVYQTWKNTKNFEQPHVPPLTNEAKKRSRERLRMSKWSVDDVVKHVKSLGCTEQAKLFELQKIDGGSFLLLTQDDIVNILKIKLGPALKIYKSIPKV